MEPVPEIVIEKETLPESITGCSFALVSGPTFSSLVCLDCKLRLLDFVSHLFCYEINQKTIINHKPGVTIPELVWESSFSWRGFNIIQTKESIDYVWTGAETYRFNQSDGEITFDLLHHTNVALNYDSFISNTGTLQSSPQKEGRRTTLLKSGKLSRALTAPVKKPVKQKVDFLLNDMDGMILSSSIKLGEKGNLSSQRCLYCIALPESKKCMMDNAEMKCYYPKIARIENQTPLKLVLSSELDGKKANSFIAGFSTISGHDLFVPFITRLDPAEFSGNFLSLEVRGVAKKVYLFQFNSADDTETNETILQTLDQTTHIYQAFVNDRGVKELEIAGSRYDTSKPRVVVDADRKRTSLLPVERVVLEISNVSGNLKVSVKPYQPNTFQ